MAELIAIGTSQLASADFTLAGTSAVIYLKSALGPSIDLNASADIQIKSSGGEYFPVGTVTTKTGPQVLTGDGTYRVVRNVASLAFGVDKN